MVINLRKELRPLRQQEQIHCTQIKKWREKAEYWKEKYKSQKDEIKDALKEMEKLRREQEKLKKQIEKLTKTKSRYQVSLFDHGNFKSKEHGKNKKTKGGQIGHTDTNRENQTSFDLSQFDKKRVYAPECGSCHQELGRVSSTRQKLLLDIVINPQVLKLIVESERQWCKVCQKEVNSKHPQSLPFSEYGLNTFMLVMILRCKAHCSMATTAKVIEIGFGLILSTSDVSNILKQSARYLGLKYEELKQAVRSGSIIYADETGWQVKGKGAWMWIMANEDTTVYVPAESRGKGIAEELYGNSQCFCLTDGYRSYLHTIPKDKHLYCWAHLLRFSYEETVNSKPNSQAVNLRDELVRIYHIKFDHPEYTSTQLKLTLEEELDTLLNLKSEEQSFVNIQNRLKEQKEGLILSLLVTKSGTNNLAERELRPMVLNRKVSYGSNTYKGMESSAIIGSIIQTFTKDKKIEMFSKLKDAIHQGVKDKYWQYNHISFSSA